MKLVQISIYGFNIIPTENKVPVINWKEWQKEKINEEFYNREIWKKYYNGIAAVCGIDRLRCLDFDKVNDEWIVTEFVKGLGFPLEYKWIS